MINFISPDYLLRGSKDQKEVWKALMDLNVFECLSAFHPVLAGTFPLNLHVEGSDLDILCEVDTHQHFEQVLAEAFGTAKDFHLKRKNIGGVKSTIARFVWKEFPVEVFGQAVPVTRQHAYRHLVVEWYLLQTRLKGMESEIKTLKRSGLSTEEAFAFLLQLKGDPYQGLIELGFAEGVLV